jgi:hypothetical protein
LKRFADHTKPLAHRVGLQPLKIANLRLRCLIQKNDHHGGKVARIVEVASMDQVIIVRSRDRPTAFPADSWLIRQQDHLLGAAFAPRPYILDDCPTHRPTL